MKTLGLALASAGMILAGSDAAQAGGGCRSGGYAGFGYSGYGGYGGFIQPSYGMQFHYGIGWQGGYGGGHLHWHDTSHWDYIPPRVIRHCDHYHMLPGGWMFHRDGHWDAHD